MLDVRIDGLPQRANGRQIEDFLQRYGEIIDIEIFRGSEDSFAFVLFQSDSKAESAIRELDDSDFCRSGHYVRVGKRGGPNSHGLPVRNCDERPELPRANMLSIRDRPRSRDKQMPRSRSRPHPRPGQEQGFIAWLGGLPSGVTEQEIEDFCRGYGKILVVRLRSSKTDTFAFVTFDDPPSGRRFVQQMDQAVFTCGAGSRVVQICESTTKTWRPDPEKQRAISQEKKYPNRFRLKVNNLPPDMSWHELKDIGREFGGGSIEFAKTLRSNGASTGVVEFTSKADAEAAIKSLDGKRMDGSNARLEVAWE